MAPTKAEESYHTREKVHPTCGYTIRFLKILQNFKNFSSLVALTSTWVMCKSV